MNYTTAVFLINKNVRAIVATYEHGDSAPKTIFKTLDQTIKSGDFVIVPTDTRHKMTVVKVMDTDVDFDIDQMAPMHWIIGKVDTVGFDSVQSQEQDAIKQIKSAELRKKREDLRNNMFADHVETLKSLQIADMNGDKAAAVEPPVTPPTPQPIPEF